MQDGWQERWVEGETRGLGSQRLRFFPQGACRIGGNTDIVHVVCADKREFVVVSIVAFLGMVCIVEKGTAFSPDIAEISGRVGHCKSAPPFSSFAGSPGCHQS